MLKSIFATKKAEPSPGLRDALVNHYRERFPGQLPDINDPAIFSSLGNDAYHAIEALRQERQLAALSKLPLAEFVEAITSRCDDYDQTVLERGEEEKELPALRERLRDSNNSDATDGELRQKIVAKENRLAAAARLKRSTQNLRDTLDKVAGQITPISNLQSWHAKIFTRISAWAEGLSHLAHLKDPVQLGSEVRKIAGQALDEIKRLSDGELPSQPRATTFSGQDIAVFGINFRLTDE